MKYLLVYLCDIFQQKLLWFLIVLQNTGNHTLKKINLKKFITVLFFRTTEALKSLKRKIGQT